MNKQILLQKLLEKIRAELEKASEASASTRALNQSADMKQEGKYDTRAIEAGYLAGAQMKRVQELKIELAIVEKFSELPHPAREAVAVGSLVELTINNRMQKYFLAPASGGTSVELNGDRVLVISGRSPLGQELLGRHLGDSFEIDALNDHQEYQIISIS